jgi:2-polyprenyl-3-methyl-5-hydroxy-6-metoxy-1,4-benzoquinol methylase
MATVTASLAHDGLTTVHACPVCGHAPPDELLFWGQDRLTGNPGRFGVARCRHCGLAFTTPRVSPEQLDSYYPRSYPSFQTRRGSFPSAGELLNQARLTVGVRRGPYRHLLRAAPGRLLDVGCGGGVLGEFFLRRGWEVCGIEPSAHGSERASERGIEVHRGTLDDAPWPPESFDAVIFNHSLEHVPDPRDAVVRAAGLLRVGGLLAVSVPNFGCWQRRAFRDRWFQLDLPRHLQHFERDTLEQLVAGAGLDLVEVRTQSMLSGLSGTLQYALFGRFVLHGAVAIAAAYATVPLLALLDLFGQGDCLGAVARRGPRPLQPRLREAR